jgi:hypothetical protein
VFAAMFAQLCMVEEIGLGTGNITVHNDDDGTHEIVVSDTPDCFAGMRTEIGANVTRDFSVGENTYFCVGKSGGVSVKDGQRYIIRGGAVGPE